jgi:DHA1 family bicyclomycin/chloramphenicol resistance-like MFS transporter
VSPADLGGSTTTLPLTATIFALSIACASAMFFLVPRPTVVVSEELMAKAEEEESGTL